MGYHPGCDVAGEGQEGQVGGLVGPQEIGQELRLFAQLKEPGRGCQGSGCSLKGPGLSYSHTSYSLNSPGGIKKRGYLHGAISAGIMHVLPAGQVFYSHYTFLLQLSGCNIHLCFSFFQRS